jgi:hypothetical protein
VTSPVSFHFVTAAEATPRYTRMARLWAWSLRTNAGVLAHAPRTVVFNDRADDDAARRLRTESGAEVLTRPRLSRTHPETNKFNALFAPALADLPADAWVVLTDCDVCCVHDLAPLVRELTANAAGPIDVAAAPEGHRATPSPTKPADWSPVRGYARLLREHAGLDDAALARLEHPWFAGHPTPTRYPYFNGGVICIRAGVLPAYRDALLELSPLLHARVRRWQPNPARLLARAWNAKVDRRPGAERRTRGWFFRERFADQVALTVAAARLGLHLGVLPHALNWRCPGMPHGTASPPMLLHYFELALGLNPERIFEPGWREDFARSHNEGRRALAKVVGDYLAACGE